MPSQREAGSPRHYPSRCLLGALDKIVTPAQQEGIHSSTALRRQAGHLRDYERDIVPPPLLRRELEAENLNRGRFQLDHLRDYAGMGGKRQYKRKI